MHAFDASQVHLIVGNDRGSKTQGRTAKEEMCDGLQPIENEISVANLPNVNDQHIGSS